MSELLKILGRPEIGKNHPFCGKYNFYYDECSYELPSLVFWGVAVLLAVGVLYGIGRGMMCAYKPEGKKMYGEFLVTMAATSLLVATGTEFLFWGIPSPWKVLWFGVTVAVMAGCGKILTRPGLAQRNLVAVVGMEILLLLGLKMVELNAERHLPLTMESPLDNLLFIAELFLGFYPLWQNRKRLSERAQYKQNRTSRHRVRQYVASAPLVRTEKIGEWEVPFLLMRSSEPALEVLLRPPEGRGVLSGSSFPLRPIVQTLSTSAPRQEGRHCTYGQRPHLHSARLARALQRTRRR